MRWGRIRASLLLVFSMAALIVGAAVPAPASLPPSDPAYRSGLPFCPPANALEMQVTAPKEGEPNLHFSFGDSRPRLTLGTPAVPPSATEVGEGNSARLGSKFQLTPAAELRVTFLYNQEQPPGQSPIAPTSQLLFRYSMDYCIMPHLKVEISGYLYKPILSPYPWRGNPSLNEPLYGFGPGIKYDLGRWSFLLRTQLEPPTKDRGEALHNWFRVWYAF